MRNTTVAILLFVLLFTGATSSCREHAGDAGRTVVAYPDALSDSLQQEIKSGDIILRCGRDQVSQLFRQLNSRNQSYSHCGVVVQTDSGAYVYHITGAADNPSGAMIREPLKRFIHPVRIERWAVLHLDLNDSSRSLFCERVGQLYAKGVHFDTQFDLETPDKLYCTELIYRSLPGADSLIQPGVSRNGKRYVAIDDLIEVSRSKIVCEITYK